MTAAYYLIVPLTAESKEQSAASFYISYCMTAAYYLNVSWAAEPKLPAAE
jgi:hypothetical protein